MAVATNIVDSATTRLVLRAVPIDNTSLASGDTNVCHAAWYHRSPKLRGGNSSVSELPNDIVIIVRIGSAARNRTMVASRLVTRLRRPGIIAGRRKAFMDGIPHCFACRERAAVTPTSR